jgi:hypothetical protein
MRNHGRLFPSFIMTLGLAALTLLGTTPITLLAQAAGTEAPPSKVEITIRDRQHGYETVGHATPSHATIITVHNKDSVTHGLASTLFRDIPVRVENGHEVTGKNFKSFHVKPGETMVLRFATAPEKFGPFAGAESVRYALWCDMHPEVKGEVYLIETRGEISGG